MDILGAERRKHNTQRALTWVLQTELIRHMSHRARAGDGYDVAVEEPVDDLTGREDCREKQ